MNTDHSTANRPVGQDAVDQGSQSGRREPVFANDGTYDAVRTQLEEQAKDVQKEDGELVSPRHKLARRATDAEMLPIFHNHYFNDKSPSLTATKWYVNASSDGFTVIGFGTAFIDQPSFPALDQLLSAESQWHDNPICPLVSEFQRKVDSDHQCRDEDKQLEQLAKKIDRAKAKGIMAILEIGEHISVSNDLLARAGRHGEFRQWVKDRCGFGIRTAYNYLAAHRRFSGQKSARLAHFSNESLYLLSSQRCPQEAVDKALELADHGKKVTKATAKELISGATTPQPNDDGGNGADTPAPDDDQPVDDDDTDAVDDESVAAADTTPPADTITVVADSPRAIEDHFGSDATVTAGGSSDEGPPAESGPDIDQLRDAFSGYVMPRVEVASPKVRKAFGAWLADEATKLRTE